MPLAEGELTPNLLTELAQYRTTITAASGATRWPLRTSGDSPESRVRGCTQR